MECQNALEVLEAARPGSGDLEDNRLAAAAAHLDVCAQCGLVFNSRQAFDRTLASAMCDVPIPAGLEQRLLNLADSAESPLQHEVAGAVDSIASESKSQPEASLDQSQRVRPTRRMWFRIAAASSVCLLAAIVFWLFPRSPEAKITLYAIHHSTPMDIEDLPDFDGDFQTTLPGVDWQNEDLHIALTPKGFKLGESDRNMSALYAFHVFLRDHSRADGVLLVVPKERVEDSDLLPGFFSSRNTEYVPRQSDEYVAVAWTKGEFVYVCFVPGDEEAIQALDVALHGSAPT